MKKKRKQLANFESEVLKRDMAAFFKEFLYGRYKRLYNSSSVFANCIRKPLCHAVQK